ncbi:MAG: hypothetical protein EBR79_01345, partial [Proteobacteria bacterium]|nr:hypothetical protein [Pseudomonadota bacterium]
DVTPLMKVARQVNDGKPFWVTKMIESKVEDAVLSLGKKDKVKVACLGLAYKPDVDDLRESPSITVVEKLAQNAALDLLVVEPHVQTWHTESGLGLVALKDALAQADVVVGLTAHKVFKELPAGALAGKVVVDACGVFYNRVDVTWDVSGFHGRGASL